MKILFCPTHYVFDDGERGSEISWAYNIVNKIALENRESYVITQFTNIKKRPSYTVVPLEKNKDAIDLGLKNSLYFNYLYTRYGLSVVKTQKFNLLHHVLPFGLDRTFNFLFLSQRFKSIPKVIGPIQSPLLFYKDTVHDAKSDTKKHYISFQQFLLSLFSPLLSYLSKKTLENADRIIVINELTQKMLVKRGLNPNNIVIIPPGVDCHTFTPRNTKKDTVTILAVGNLIERKGFPAIIKGYAKTTSHYKNSVLRIIGDGPLKQELLDLVRQLSIEDRVVFEGQVPHFEMSRIYQEADIFLSMSHSEGFATVCLEAMASGLVVISTPVGGFVDAIIHKENGFIVKDDKELTHFLTMTLKDKEMRERLKKKAREEMVQKYDWDRSIIPRYKKLYKEILST